MRDPGDDDSVGDVFGSQIAGVYDEDWVMYRRDEASGTYVKLALTDPLAIGIGYWIFTRVPATTVEMEGGANPETDVALLGDPTGLPNQMGHPFDFDVCWADVLVDDGVSLLSLADVDPGGICQTDPADAACLMSRVMHKWNGNAYLPFDGQTPGAEGTLQPWDSFWVKVSGSGLELRVPKIGGPCSGSAPIVLPGHGPEQGWWVRLTASADGMVDPGNVLGQLPDSATGYDAHDLIELPPIGERYLTVVFPHGDWGARSGDYSTDFHALGRGSHRDSWPLEVWASAGVEQVTLTWEGPEELLERSFLVDEVSGKRLPVEPGGRVTVELEGGMHPFTWHLGSPRTGQR